MSQLLPESFDHAGLAEWRRRSSTGLRQVVDDARPTGRLLAEHHEFNIRPALRRLDDARQLRLAVRPAMLQAVLRQILDRLRPY